jgi:hypothetical protein
VNGIEPCSEELYDDQFFVLKTMANLKENKITSLDEAG